MNLLLIGSAGHASVIVDVLETCGDTVMGYLDDNAPPGSMKRGYRVLGTLADRERVSKEWADANLVLAIGDNWWRRKIWREMTTGARYPVIQHPTACISRSAHIGEGTVLMAGARVGPGSRVGRFAIINTGASLDHDCVLEDFASLAPGAFTGGSVEIGRCSAIGVGAAISDQVKIGDHAVVGTGSVVVRDVPRLAVAYGNPARIRRTRREDEKYMGTQGSRQ